jgi:hypothetical protein
MANETYTSIPDELTAMLDECNSMIVRNAPYTQVVRWHSDATDRLRQALRDNPREIGAWQSLESHYASRVYTRDAAASGLPQSIYFAMNPELSQLRDYDEVAASAQLLSSARLILLKCIALDATGREGTWPSPIVENEPDLWFIQDKRLRHICLTRIREGKLLNASCAFEGCGILLGAALEGILYAMVDNRLDDALLATAAPKKRGGEVMQEPVQWQLGALLDVAQELGWITDEAARLAQPLRPHRKWNHPAKRLAEITPFDRTMANVCIRAVEKCVRDIGAFLSNISQSTPDATA